MKKILSILLTVLSLLLDTPHAFGQDVIAIPKSYAIVAKHAAKSNLVIPVEIDFINATQSIRSAAISIAIDLNSDISAESRLGEGNASIINDRQSFNIDPLQTKSIPNKVFVLVDQNAQIVNDKIIRLNVFNAGSLLSVITVTIQPDDSPLSLAVYSDGEGSYLLDYVTKVESNNNILTVSGYKALLVSPDQEKDVFLKRNVALEQGEVLAVIEWGSPFHLSHWQAVPISLTTIPFKVRPQISAGGNEFKGVADAGISNIGFNLEVFQRQSDRYFSSGTKSTHKFSAGFFAAPSVEELDATNTNGFLGKDEKSKQLYLSTAITISYSYNDISFIIVPAGWDFGTSTTGKSWVYDGRRWWGFGIGVSPKIFDTILNK